MTKIKYTVSLLLFLAFGSSFGQAPENFSYQAVVRNSSNEIIANSQVGVRMKILQGTATGTVVYAETHTLNTDANGLISLKVGGGSSSDDFSLINWGVGPFFLEREIDPDGGTTYSMSGVDQLLSVPYALHSKVAKNIPLTNGKLFIGNTSGKGAEVTLSGDATVTNAGVLTISDEAIGSDEVSDNSLTADDLATGSVTSDEIANGSISDEDLNKTAIPLSGFGPATSAVDLGGKTFTNVQDPVSAQDAATKAYVDALQQRFDALSLELTIPKILSFSPTSVAAGNTVTISGTNLAGATVVSFGGTSASSFNVVNSGTITAVVAVSTSSGNVSVTTPGGTANRSGYTFILTDAVDNVYSYATIGTQTWMTENLKTTKYNDGTSIPEVTDNTTWTNMTSPGYTWMNNNPTTYSATFGALYNWYTVDNTSNGGKNVCPGGWHVPSNSEWSTFESYLIANGYNYDGTTSGNKLSKSLATASGWLASSVVGAVGNTDFASKQNATGFSTVPEGYRDSDASFKSLDRSGGWWLTTSSNTTDAWYSFIYHDSFGVDNGTYGKKAGFSVRCLKD
ncbi:MAG: FISUMP domain-containing protein [Imperialibacter sp.]|uniref:FISUMP domain-containing protein n=1 Tax=Imperialibacter sp. TaxID=2038411 RepID=UPI0032ECD2EC